MSIFSPEARGEVETFPINKEELVPIGSDSDAGENHDLLLEVLAKGDIPGLTSRNFKQRENIYYDGDPAEQVMFLGKGTVIIHTDSPNGQRHISEVLQPPSVFSEAALSKDGTHRSSATALSDCEVYCMRKNDLFALTRKRVDLGLELFGFLGEREETSIYHVVDILLASPEARVAKALLTLSSNQNISFFEQDIADLSSYSRESVSGVIGKFRLNGVIGIGDHLAGATLNRGVLTRVANGDPLPIEIRDVNQTAPKEIPQFEAGKEDLQKVRVSRFKRGQIIYHQGDSTEQAMFLYEGTVIIHTNVGDKRHISEVLQPPSVFSEAALSKDGTHRSSATALSDCVVYRMKKNNLFALIRGNTELGLGLLGLLARREFTSMSHVADIAYQDTSIAQALLLLSSNPKAEYVEQDIADLTGYTREYVIKTIRRFKNSGVIRKHLRILHAELDKEALTRVAHEQALPVVVREVNAERSASRRATP